MRKLEMQFKEKELLVQLEMQRQQLEAERLQRDAERQAQHKWKCSANSKQPS